MEDEVYIRVVGQRFLQALKACRTHSNPRTVHELRTGVRRMEALLRKVIEDFANVDADNLRTKKLSYEIKQVRKLAGSVRDLDVHRELIKNLLKAKPPADLQGEFEELDAHFKRERKQLVRKLRRRLRRDESRLERTLKQAEKFIAGLDGKTPTPLATARRWVRRERFRLNVLSETTLHDYRKRTKAARYVAELQTNSAAALRFAKQLRQLQNLMGAWRDWDLLMGRAKEVLGEDAGCLPPLKRKRDLALKKALRAVRQG